MKFMQIAAGALIMGGLSFASNWTVDTENAKVNFSVKGPFGTVHGSFTGLKAAIKFDEKELGTSSISASLEAKSVSTGVGLRNHDLRTEEQWLDTDKFPHMGFKSTKIEKTDKGFKAIGELTIKGTTKPVEIPFTFTNKESSGLFKGQFQIKREDYKVGKEGGSVGSVISVSLEVPVKK
ncbi:MAG TPA: YceI family protein [Puia sp.]|jgi:polyisoprenoid-binding protein YceI|nr:YceI family protein [Puia sp.]